MGTGNWGPSGCGKIVPAFFMNAKKRLDIYVDESGDYSKFSAENPLYSVAFILVNNSDDNSGPIHKFEKNLSNLIGGNHFVHVGNLVRGEKPYEEMLREERWKLFYALHLFAYYAKYRIIVSSVIKKETMEEIVTSITNALFNVIDDYYDYLNNYEEIILHYDYGQRVLTEIITTIFLSKFSNCKMYKTAQSQSPFMQLADLFAYFEMLKYKVSRGYLTKSESKFFCGIRNLRDNHINKYAGKYITKKK